MRDIPKWHVLPDVWKKKPENSSAESDERIGTVSDGTDRDGSVRTVVSN